MSWPLRKDRYVGSSDWTKSNAACTKSGGRGAGPASDDGRRSGDATREEGRLLDARRPADEPADDDRLELAAAEGRSAEPTELLFPAERPADEEVPAALRKEVGGEEVVTDLVPLAPGEDAAEGVRCTGVEGLLRRALGAGMREAGIGSFERLLPGVGRAALGATSS
jgi:hypothetical protein